MCTCITSVWAHANLGSAGTVYLRRKSARERSPMDRSRQRSNEASSPRRRSPEWERVEEKEGKKKKRRRERSKSRDEKKRRRSKSRSIMATASKAPPVQPQRPLDIAGMVARLNPPLWRPPLMRPPPLLMRPPPRPIYGYGEQCGWQGGGYGHQNGLQWW